MSDQLHGSAALAYRWYCGPTTLTIAVGSLDGEAARIVSAIAARLVSMKAPVPLSVIDVPSALDAAQGVCQGHSGAGYQKDLGDYTMKLVNRMMWFDPDQTRKRGNLPRP